MVLIVTKDNREAHADVLYKMYRHRFEVSMVWRNGEDCWMKAGNAPFSFDEKDAVYFIKFGRKQQIVGGFVLNPRRVFEPSRTLHGRRTEEEHGVYAEFSSFFIADHAHRDGRGHPAAYELFCALMTYLEKNQLAGVIGCLDCNLVPHLKRLPWTVRQFAGSTDIEGRDQISLRDDVCVLIEIDSEAHRKFASMSASFDLYFRRLNAENGNTGPAHRGKDTLRACVDYMIASEGQTRNGFNDALGQMRLQTVHATEV